MSSRRNTNFIARVLKEANIAARYTFQSAHHKPKRKTKKVVSFVYKGNYYRRPIPTSKKSEKAPPELLKIPPAGQAVLPKPFKTPPPEFIASSKSAHGGSGSKQQSTWSWSSWWKLNAPLLILNFGSLATLVGFTRRDVLELRALSMTGSTTFVIYSLLQPPPIRWPSIVWSTLFAGVNGYKILGILNERKGNVVLSPREEEIYHEHFQPHGVTPKQFEKAMRVGTIRTIKKGELVSRQGIPISSVKLVIRGNTRASVMGRHLTAIGSARGNRQKFAGGDSGAWVGEMAFLQSMWDKDHAPKNVASGAAGATAAGVQNKPSKPNTTTATDEGSKSNAVIRSGLSPSDGPNKYYAISTIVATEDIEVIEWSFEDMEKLMKSSVDMQGSMTRAMTAAIVGKVVNFMVSRQQTALPSWTTWLDNWKAAVSTPDVDDDDDDEEGEDEEEELKKMRLFQRGQV